MRCLRDGVWRRTDAGTTRGPRLTAAPDHTAVPLTTENAQDMQHSFFDAPDGIQGEDAGQTELVESEPVELDDL